MDTGHGPEHGAELLGLNCQQANIFFSAFNTREQLGEIVEALNGGRETWVEYCRVLEYVSVLKTLEPNDYPYVAGELDQLAVRMITDEWVDW